MRNYFENATPKTLKNLHYEIIELLQFFKQYCLKFEL